MNPITLPVLSTHETGQHQSLRHFLFTHVDATVMKNLLLLVIGGILFFLCYRVSRLQAVYAAPGQELNQQQLVKTDIQQGVITSANNSLVMRVTGF